MRVRVLLPWSPETSQPRGRMRGVFADDWILYPATLDGKEVWRILHRGRPLLRREKGKPTQHGGYTGFAEFSTCGQAQAWVERKSKP